MWIACLSAANWYWLSGIYILVTQRPTQLGHHFAMVIWRILKLSDTSSLVVLHFLVQDENFRSCGSAIILDLLKTHSGLFWAHFFAKSQQDMLCAQAWPSNYFTFLVTDLINNSNSQVESPLGKLNLAHNSAIDTCRMLKLSGKSGPVVFHFRVWDGPCGLCVLAAILICENIFRAIPG